MANDKREDCQFPSLHPQTPILGCRNGIFKPLLRTPNCTDTVQSSVRPVRKANSAEESWDFDSLLRTVVSVARQRVIEQSTANVCRIQREIDSPQPQLPSLKLGGHEVVWRHLRAIFDTGSSHLISVRGVWILSLDR